MTIPSIPKKAAVTTMLHVDMADKRPVQLPKAVTQALDSLRFADETWDEFVWRVILSPRGFLRAYASRPAADGDGDRGEIS